MLKILSAAVMMGALSIQVLNLKERPFSSSRFTKIMTQNRIHVWNSRISAMEKNGFYGRPQDNRTCHIIISLVFLYKTYVVFCMFYLHNYYKHVNKQDIHTKTSRYKNQIQ